MESRGINGGEGGHLPPAPPLPSLAVLLKRATEKQEVLRLVAKWDLWEMEEFLRKEDLLYVVNSDGDNLEGLIPHIAFNRPGSGHQWLRRHEESEEVYVELSLIHEALAAGTDEEVAPALRALSSRMAPPEIPALFGDLSREALARALASERKEVRKLAFERIPDSGYAKDHSASPDKPDEKARESGRARRR